MNESQIKWLEDLQSKGVEIECKVDSPEEYEKAAVFELDASKYIFPAQPIPDIPDWRKVCWSMQRKGVRFKFLWGCMWEQGEHEFTKERDRYQIFEQPLPKWREDMHEHQKSAVTTIVNSASLSLAAQELKEKLDKIPHRELQIQWHKDWIHSLETGEPMPEWEWRNASGEWVSTGGYFVWAEGIEYRYKPRTVRYWHCVVEYVDNGTGGTVSDVLQSAYDKDELLSDIKRYQQKYPTAKFTPIVETVTELED